MRKSFIDVWYTQCESKSADQDSMQNMICNDDNHKRHYGDAGDLRLKSYKV